MQTKRETFHAKKKGEWPSFPFQIADKPYEEVTEGLQPFRLDSYRPAMPVVQVGFGFSRNHSLHFSRQSALLTVKNVNSTKGQSHFIDTLKGEWPFESFPFSGGLTE